MALVLAVLMIAAMVPAGLAEVPTNGSITVNSPIVGATYTAYKVFDMSVNDGVTSFAYTIDDNNPFFNTVKTYANMPAQLPDANADGLTLTVTADTATATVKTYNVAVTDAFDPQAFGQALLAALKGDATADPAVVALDASSVAETPIEVTVANSERIQFTDLDLGYFLITSEYPEAEFSKVTMTVKDYEGNAILDDNEEEQKYEFDKTSLKDANAAVNALELSDATKGTIAEYVKKVVDDKYVEAYITAKNLKDKDANGNEIAIAKDSDRWNEVKTEIINSMKADAEAQVLNALKNQLESSESEINLAKDPILVFLDSSKPEAVINEKNEIDKWETPVNPSGDALPKDLPDHGEPNGGKNIVINENPAVYADWAEAKTGDDVHYRLTVNAMNFVREGDGTDPANQATANKVQQVKEYFLADYQSGHMSFNADRYLRVTVWDDNGTNVTRDAEGKKVDYLDYTDKKDTFFKNTTDQDAATKPADIFGTGTGIMVPWVIVSKDASLKSTYPVYTTTKVPTGEYKKPETGHEEDYVLDDDGYVLDEDNARIPLYDTYYVYSLYKSDVTIHVDYYMTLNDNAIVDEPGNKNYAQYGYSPVENKDGNGNPKKPTPPSDEDKPSVKREVDEATVYTYAIAFVKVDNKANQLAGAKFQLPFYVKTTKDKDTYVYGGTAAGTGLTNEVVTTTESARITIKGLTAGTYAITEIEAPAGYNKLAEPFTLEAKKSGQGVTTKTETVIYLDAENNITETVTTKTVEYKTDEDSFNNKKQTASDEEETVPVYEYKYIENQKGTELPSTGGMGTTIFYVAGSILVLAAAILLITKRRMGSED